MTRKGFLMSLVGFFLLCSLTYAGATDIQPGKAASDKNIQATETAPASASGEKMAAPEAYSKPEKEEAGALSKDTEENAPAEKDATAPGSPEKAPSAK